MSTARDGWRGVAAEEVDDVAGALAAFLRGRSRRLLGDLLRPHRRAIALSIGTITLFNLFALAGPWLVKLGIDKGIPPLDRDGDIGPLAVIVTFFVLATVARSVCDYTFTRLVGRIGEDVLYDLRTRLAAHFQSLSLSFHEQYTSGRVISRLTSDIDAIAELLVYGLQVLSWALLWLVSSGVLMLLLDVELALVALAAFPVVAFLTVWFRNRSARAYRESREAVALVIVQFVESMGGIRAVQAFRREERNQEIFEEFDERLKRANVWSWRLIAVYGPGVKMLGNITAAAVLFVGGSRVLDGDITVGVLAAFLLYLREFFEPVLELSQFYNVFQAAGASLEKLSGVLEEEPTVPEPFKPSLLLDARGEIRFEGVRFGYRDTDVLPGLDLVIPAGQTVALVGETGAGKTTVARLIARFYDPNDGRVMLDGVDLRNIADVDLRRAVVMLTQEGFIFSGSVADNIAFGRPDATRAEIEAAACAIGAHEFIAALPDGYDTAVEKKGGRLSAGQRQLVAFARAFLADPAVLVLDEATSSLDIPSERAVQRALHTLLADRTAVIIAHRLSTVEIADRVLVLDGGHVVEDGTPAALVAAGDGGRYGALHRQWVDSLV